MRLLDEGSQVVVGREPPSEVVVDDPSVSRQHVRFTLRDSEVWVEDLDSRNGTFKRGKKLSRERLDPSDELAVGKVRIVVAATGTDAEQAPASLDAEYVILNPKMTYS